VSAAVARYHGCLGDLPRRLRFVLELRVGIGVPHPLSRAAVSRFLHLPPAQVSSLERRALRRLRATARTRGCAGGGASSSVAEVIGPNLAGLPVLLGGAGIAGIGIGAARYSLPFPGGGSRSIEAPASGASLSGEEAPSVAGNLILFMIMVVGGMGVIGYVATDGMGRAPRHREWLRRQVRRRP
jgi:Sigma-70, region 4